MENKIFTASILDIEIAEVKDGEKPTFKMLGYSGGIYNDRDLILDVSKMKIRKNLPILLAHDHEKIVGMATKIDKTSEGEIIIDGIFTGDTSDKSSPAGQVVSHAKNGFKWSASISWLMREAEYIDEKVTRIVNGREIKGPVYVSGKTELLECSFVSVAADNKTAGNQFINAEIKKELKMEKEIEKTETVSASVVETIEPAIDNDIKEQKARTAAELRRQANIMKAAGDHKNIAADAIEQGWTIDKVELEVMKASLPSISVKSSAPAVESDKVLVAAMLKTAGADMNKLAKDRQFGEQVVDRADSLGTMTLHGLMAYCLASIGEDAPRDGKALLAKCVQHQASFSSTQLPGILGAVANKLMIDAFMSVNTTYNILAQQADFNNFYTRNMYRLDNSGTFQKVESDGELKHGVLVQDAYTNKLETYGQIIGLTRQQLINDELDAFSQLVRMLGRKSAVAVERALYGEVCEAGDTFYTDGRGNRLTTCALSIEGLARAEAALAAQVDQAGDPIYATPKYLVVPPALKSLADQIYTSTNVVVTDLGGTAAKRTTGVSNPYVGRFEVVTSPYLALATVNGSSSTTWYLVADPMSVPAFQVAYLNGNRTPVIETADTEFNTLGMQTRAYFDFGCAQVDYRGAVKCTA